MCRIVRYEAFTLLEMLVALVLSSLLMLMVSALFTSLLFQYQRQQSLNDTQAHARVAVHWISELLHSAGNCGCQSAFQREQVDSHVLGYEDFFSHDKLVQIESGASLIVHRVALEGVSLLDIDRNNAMLMVSNAVSFNENDVVLVSDCVHAEIVAINAVSSTEDAQRLILSSRLLYDYTATATVDLLEVVRVWVNNTGRKTRQGRAVYGLYTKTNNEKIFEVESFIDALSFQSFEQGRLVKMILSLPLFSKEMTWVRYVDVTNAAILLTSPALTTSSPAQAGDPYKKNNK